MWGLTFDGGNKHWYGGLQIGGDDQIFETYCSET